jgi:inosine-uridine nucleoside N-ribohydrolase
MPIPLLLDTDIGDDVDDVFALLLAAGEPALHLVGVTTVYGDAPHRARVARKVLDLAGKAEVPVIAGHSRSLAGDDLAGAPGTHMTSARGFVGPPGSEEWDALGERLGAGDAVDFLIQTVTEASEPPVLAAVGPLTNVADAFRRSPEIVGKLRSVVLMGGRLGPEAARGEHNFNSDPEATRLVLESGAPLRIGTYEITCQARIGEAELPRLRAGSPASRAAADQLELYIHRHNRQATSMYDPLSLTLAYTDRFLPTAPVAITVARTAPRLVELAVREGVEPTAHVSVNLHAAAFVEHLLTTIGA